MSRSNEHERPADEELDELLAAQAGSEKDARLAERILSAPDVRLERVLGRLPRPELPAGLTQRILDGVADERAAQQRARFRLIPGRTLAVLAALAAVLLLYLGARSLQLQPATESSPNVDPFGTTKVAHGSRDDEELLGSLDILENWELLTSTELDLLLVELDDVAELMLELDGEPATERENG